MTFDLTKALTEAQDLWYKLAKSELMIIDNLIQFIDSQNLTSYQLKRLLTAIDDMKPSDDEDESLEDQFDRQEAQNGQY